jgi:S-adenosylmethionine:tRNA ribosyltransferase-isomerase
MLRTIAKKGIDVVEISLNVGLVTFQPIRTEKVEDHTILTENLSIGPDAARIINKAKKENRHVAAVGTTTVRTLESTAHEIKTTKIGKSAEDGRPIFGVKPGQQATDLFIYPGFNYRITDLLLTNFHLPKSTLLMLVSAFAGKNFIMEAYREAVDQKYRFYSYGDCMVII